MGQSNRVGRAGTACVWWGIGVIVLGVLVSLFGTNLLYALAGDSLNTGAVAGATMALSYVLVAIQGVGVPLGSAILGAGIVLRVLAPREAAAALVDDELGDELDDDIDDDIDDEVNADSLASAEKRGD